METVFIVLDCDYEGSEILGVFKNRKDAEKAGEDFEEYAYGSIGIKEVEVKEVYDKSFLIHQYYFEDTEDELRLVRRDKVPEFSIPMMTPKTETEINLSGTGRVYIKSKIDDEEKIRKLYQDFKYGKELPDNVEVF